jgi:S1-C subfamily serine protease
MLMLARCLSIVLIAAAAFSADGANLPIPDAVAKAAPSIVAIGRVRLDDAAPPLINRERFPAEDYRTGPGPADPDFLPHEYGIGVVVDRGGLILTSLHFLGEIRQSKYFVWVQRRAFPAKVKAADPWLDVAVLEIGADDLQPIELESAHHVASGDEAIVVGDPLALARDGEPDFTLGRIVRTACEAPAQALPVLRNGFEQLTPRRDTLHHFGTMLQFEASSPADRGGLLINSEGRLIGLMTAYVAHGNESPGGLAIPIDSEFEQALETLKAGKLPEYGLLGLAPRAAKLADAAFKAGAAVEDVMPGTPAAKVGLRPGDIITQVGEQAVQDDLHLIRLVSALPAQAKVTLQVVRDMRTKKSFPVSVTLSKKYHESLREAYAEQREPAWRGMRVDYATASPVFRELARHVDPEGCVSVVDVERDSPAWKAGLRNGTFVSHVGGKRVSTPQQFYDEANKQAGEAALRITVAGDGEPIRKVAAP